MTDTRTPPSGPPLAPVEAPLARADAMGAAVGAGRGAARAGDHQGAGEAAAARRLEDDLLAAVRAAVRGAGALGVGEVLRRHVHAQPLGAQRAGGDVEGAEEPHHLPPIADSRMSMRPRATC